MNIWILIPLGLSAILIVSFLVTGDWKKIGKKTKSIKATNEYLNLLSEVESAVDNIELLFVSKKLDLYFKKYAGRVDEHVLNGYCKEIEMAIKIKKEN